MRSITSMSGQLAQAVRILSELQASDPVVRDPQLEDMRRAKGLVFMTQAKAGFVLSATVSAGFLIRRLPDGGWSAPASLGAAGLGMGLLAGAQTTDIIITLSTDAAVEELVRSGRMRFGGDAHFTYYKQKYGLNQPHFGEDVRAVENMEFISQGSVNNALCFVGPHRRYNPFSSNFFELVPGQGHFGPDAIPGDARWRRGESVSLRAARNSMVGLEVAAQSQLALRAVDGIPP